MKVLIIGKDSYIGNHIDKWLCDKGWQVSQLDVLNEDWRGYNYAQYDVIVHVAGIVHRPDCNDWNLYKSVNTDMPIYIARKAKEQGRTRNFVFFSSMAVYGIEKGLKPTIINEETPLFANSMYGKSKLMAEEGLKELQDETFNISFVRPPSVYGKGCKGNYIPGFTRVVEKLPIFPVAYQNVRQSMIYIDNLCEFVYQIILNNLFGGFCPQDEKSVNAIEILDAIADGKGIKRYHSRILGVAVTLLSFLSIVKKAYGGVEYKESLSHIDNINYVVVPFKEGMRKTIR